MGEQGERGDGVPGSTEGSDAELLRRCRTAQRAGGEAFAALYRRHAGPLLAFLRGMLGEEHGARDALQETFLRLHRALPELDPGRPLRPWLFRVARNASLDALKRRGAKSEVPHEPAALAALGPRDPRPGPPDVAQRREAAALLRGAALALPEDERAVFLLRHDRGLSFEEVAEALGCSLRTAKYRMKAALEALGREAERLGVRG